MALIKNNSNWPALTDFFDDNWLKSQFQTPNWSPAINVVDNEEQYEIEIAAPGIKKNDFSVTVESGVLTVSGKAEQEEEQKTKNYTRREFSSQSFQHSFTLPANISEDSVVAKYEDGVLKITINKTETALPPRKEVSIQ